MGMIDQEKTEKTKIEAESSQSRRLNLMLLLSDVLLAMPSAVMAPVFTGKSQEEYDGQQNNEQHADAKHHWVPPRGTQHARDHITNYANGAATGAWVTAGHGQVGGSPTDGGHCGEQ
jgi:hypothetical protein